MTTQLHSNFRMANLFDLLPKVTTLKGIKVWTQHRSKGKPLNETNGHLDVDSNGHPDPSHLALHTEK